MKIEDCKQDFGLLTATVLTKLNCKALNEKLLKRKQVVDT